MGERKQGLALVTAAQVSLASCEDIWVSRRLTAVEREAGVDRVYNSEGGSFIWEVTRQSEMTTGGTGSNSQVAADSITFWVCGLTGSSRWFC